MMDERSTREVDTQGEPDAEAQHGMRSRSAAVEPTGMYLRRFPEETAHSGDDPYSARIVTRNKSSVKRMPGKRQ